MAFNFHKGPQKIDDIISQLDTNADTKIDLGDNQINIDVSGSTALSVKVAAVEITGTLNVTSDVILSGGVNIGGASVIGEIAERIIISTAASGTVTFDTLKESIFFNSGPTGNITANFTNMSTTSNRATSATVILSQSATPRTISAVQINSTSSTINWANKVTPTPNANQYDIFGFSLIRSGSTWITLGQMSTYG